MPAMKAGSTGLVLIAAGFYAVCALLLAGQQLGEPGIYYDEVIQVAPTLDFLRGEDEPLRVPGARSVSAFGRWIPWMTQPYMGALKSQLLIPVFALFDATPESLRATTLLWTLAGLPFVMLFANRLAGLPVALITGALLAVDPALLFLGRHDWGSFALGFLLRCAALWWVQTGLRNGSTLTLAAGGLCLGLGVYNKIDFGVFLLAALVALWIVAPREVLRLLREERRKGIALGAGLAIGALPLVVAAGAALSVAGAAARGGSLLGELPEKWAVLWSVLDGSYFLRLMHSGGRFEDLATVPDAVGDLAPFAFALSALVIVAVWRSPRLRAPEDRGAHFLLLTALLIWVGILLTPRALRAHHFLNVLPFPQLVIAAGAVLLWTRVARIAPLASRGLAVGLVVATLLSCLAVDRATLELLRQTGGRGRWSHAVEELARTLPPEQRVVSLDWGFDGPIRFFAPEAATDEPIWRLRRGGAAARIEGGPDRVYLVHEARYAVMPYGGALLAALPGLPEGAVQVSVHRDRGGEPVFRAIRFTRPHELVYRGGRFEVKLR